MTKYIRKNQKKILAIFSVGLMVAFALPSMTSNSRRTEATVGSIEGGKATLGAREYNAYRGQWLQLKTQFGPRAMCAVLGGVDRVDESYVIKALGDAQLSQRVEQLMQIVQQNPQLLQIFARQDPEAAVIANASMEGTPVYSQIESIDDLFPLLVKEAQLMGVGVNGDLIESILTARGLSHDADPELYESMQQSLRSLLMVNNAASRAANVMKVSQPELANLLATQRQQIAVSAIEFSAKDFLDKVPAPTPQQLQEQFDKFKNKEAGEGQMDFGYKYPNRVKYEVVQINRDEVKKGAGPVELEQIWEYYLRNKDNGEFIKDTGPSTRPEDALALRPAPTTRPMTFDEAKEKIVPKLTEERVEQLSVKVRDAVRNTMKADYDAYRAAVGEVKSPTTGPTTAMAAATQAAAPASSLGVPYNSYDYLKKLRDKIQADLKVTVTIEQQDAWQTPKTLEESPLGKAQFTVNGRVPLAYYMSQILEPFLNEAQRKQVAGMRGDNKPATVWEPTPVFTDAKDDMLIARATAADAAHVPASVDEVKDKVASDVKTAAAFEKAKQAAQQALDAAKDKWLVSVASDQGKNVISTGLFTAADAGRSATPVAVADLKGAALDSFVQGSFKLLALPPRSGEAPRPVTTQPTTKPAATQSSAAATKPAKTTAKATTRPTATTKPVAATMPTTAGATVVAAFKDHPVGLVEVPAAGKVMVAEVDQVKPMWTKDRQAMWDTGVAFQQRVAFEQMLRMAWFDYGHVVDRLKYVPEEKRDRKGPTPQPLPPVSPF
jgi:hypothetical protein